MGYELQKLMNMYGVSTSTMAAAPQMPGAAPTAPTAPVLAEGATRDQRKKYEEDLAAFNASKEKYATDKTAFDESVRKYGLDKAQYDQYAQNYQNRLANTNMYNQAQFSTTGANVPAFTTYSDAQKAALGYGPAVTPTVGAPTVGGGEATAPVMPQPGPQDFTGMGQSGLNQQIQQYMGTNPSTSDMNAYMARYGLTDMDMRNAMGTGTQYGTPQWTDVISAPSYGMMPITFGQMSEQDRANWYNTQRGLGYTDADLRANAESTFGQMSDPNFSQMTGGAYTPPSISNPTGSSNGFLRRLREGMQSTGEAYTPPSVSNPTSSSNGFLRRLREGMQSNRAEGGYIQNYAQGGAVQGYQRGGPPGTIYGGAGDDMLMGRPADDMLDTAPAPVAEDPLMTMLARYALPVDRSAEIAAATERRAAEQKTLEELLMKQLDVQDNAPQSKAEMYLRLAAAFGAPTKTGHFSENLALVGQTMADELAARSQREREDRANRLGIQTELQKMRLGAAGEALAAEQELQKSDMEYGRDLYKESLKGSEGKFRRATKEEAAAYGAEGGQFGPDGRFYAIDVPQGMTVESDGQGGFRLIQGPGAGKSDKPPTEGQLGSAAYLQRMTKAEAILRDLERTEEVVTIPLEKTLLMGTGAEGYILNSTEQRVAQAQRDWVRAKLRKESGAVIGAEEMAEEIKTYFPQPGESPETIAQKAASRRSAEEQMRITSGTAAEEAGEISPEYAPPIRADELARAGIGGGPAPQPVVINGVAPPKVGTIDNGYRFKGGNPADPNNWEKV